MSDSITAAMASASAAAPIAPSAPSPTPTPLDKMTPAQQQREAAINALPKSGPLPITTPLQTGPLAATSPTSSSATPR